MPDRSQPDDQQVAELRGLHRGRVQRNLLPGPHRRSHTPVLWPGPSASLNEEQFVVPLSYPKHIELAVGKPDPWSCFSHL